MNMWDRMRPDRRQLLDAARQMAFTAKLDMDTMERIAAEMVRRAQLNICRGYLGEACNDEA